MLAQRIQASSLYNNLFVAGAIRVRSISELHLIYVCLLLLHYNIVFNSLFLKGTTWCNGADYIGRGTCRTRCG